MLSRKFYLYQKGCSAPTHFLVNTGFTASLYKIICFDQLIKAYFPTLRCLHQSIDGSLELAYFVNTFWIDKTFWLHHIQLFLRNPLRIAVLLSICQISNNVATANMIQTDFKHRYE